jgi:hypothetical protein
MGNAPASEGQKYIESANASLTIESAPAKDPLRNYIKHHSSFDVKTLADVENSSLKLAQTRKGPVGEGGNGGNGGKENSHPSTPSSRIENNRNVATAPNTRFSHDLTSSACTPSPQRTPRRLTNIEQQFKAIAISQETFMKVRKESPEVSYDIREKIG